MQGSYDHSLSPVFSSIRELHDMSLGRLWMEDMFIYLHTCACICGDQRLMLCIFLDWSFTVPRAHQFS